MLASPEALAWHTGAVYRGHSLKRKGSGWLLVVRVTLEGRRVVAFMSGETIGDVFRMFAVGASFDEVEWWEDNYA